jgi:Ca-activated chloride channel family protein
MKLIARSVCSLVVAGIAVGPSRVSAQDAPNLVFRSSVDVVSVTAVVRDRRHRVVTSLGRHDVQVLDAGELQPILEMKSESSAPASVALLVDGSGSMRIGAASAAARRISEGVLASLEPSRDDAALMTFDRRLITVADFTHDFGQIRASLDTIEAFGSTSLYDAIAGAAGMVGDRTQNRRAVVVLTDGLDTTSAYSPERVSAIASSIDVPVYIFALGEMGTGVDESGRPGGALGELARETGGDLIVANTPKLMEAGIRRLVEELRHQYLISFKANAFDGLRRVQIRTVRRDLTVRSRAWYFAGE